MADSFFVAVPTLSTSESAEYEKLPGGVGVSIIVESIATEGVGPRLHRHPYAETFVVRRGSVTFTVGPDQVLAVAGQVLVVPALVPHTFRSGPEGYEGVHVHVSDHFITEWLE